MSRGIDRPGMRVYDGAVRPARQQCQPREARAGGSDSAGLGGWGRKIRDIRSTVAVRLTSNGLTLVESIVDSVYFFRNLVYA